MQDEITLKIIDALQIKLTVGEQARIWEVTNTNIHAFDKQMRGFECFYRFNEKDNKQARHFFEEAINIDKDYALPYNLLGFAHMLDLALGWSKSPIESFEQADKHVEKALALNDSIDIAHGLVGWIYLFKRQHDEVIKAGERAIELNPNGAEAHVQLAFILIFSDKAELAIKLLKRAFRLNPIPQSYYYDSLGIAYRVNGQYEKAIEICKKALSDSPDNVSEYITLAASYSPINRAEDASKAVEEILRIQPDLSLEYFVNTLPYKNQEELDKFINALRKAGLPE